MLPLYMFPGTPPKRAIALSRGKTLKAKRKSKLLPLEILDDLKSIREMNVAENIQINQAKYWMYIV